MLVCKFRLENFLLLNDLILSFFPFLALFPLLESIEALLLRLTNVVTSLSGLEKVPKFEEIVLLHPYSI